MEAFGNLWKSLLHSKSELISPSLESLSTNIQISPFASVYFPKLRISLVGSNDFVTASSVSICIEHSNSSYTRSFSCAIEFFCVWLFRIYKPVTYKVALWIYIFVILQLENSNGSQVMLRNVDFKLNGNFSCEVTTDAPSFSTAVVTKYLTVVCK